MIKEIGINKYKIVYLLPCLKTNNISNLTSVGRTPRVSLHTSHGPRSKTTDTLCPNKSHGSSIRNYSGKMLLWSHRAQTAGIITCCMLCAACTISTWLPGRPRRPACPLLFLLLLLPLRLERLPGR